MLGDNLEIERGNILNGGKVKVLVTLCHGNQNKLQLYGSQGRKSGEPCLRETLRARMRNITKLRPCVTPGTGIKPNSQQWEASLSLSEDFWCNFIYLRKEIYSESLSWSKWTKTNRNWKEWGTIQIQSRRGIQKLQRCHLRQRPSQSNLCEKKKRNKDLQTKRGFGDPQILTEPSSEQVAKR